MAQKGEECADLREDIPYVMQVIRGREWTSGARIPGKNLSRGRKEKIPRICGERKGIQDTSG